MLATLYICPVSVSYCVTNESTVPLVVLLTLRPPMRYAYFLYATTYKKWT
jgi:hypothetical protein